MQKKKILIISDHALSTSGVGVQSRYLIMGLIATGKYSFRQFGAAVKHESYETIKVNDDFIIRPVDGFGTIEMLRIALATERPDALVLFTDPRFFVDKFQVEDEIHQICPIVYNHLWDQCEFPPSYNKILFESCDTINCINRPTYEFLKKDYPDRVNWAPHALPKEMFYEVSQEERKNIRQKLLKGRSQDEFVALWVARNARRKMPGDVLWSWKMFLDQLEQKHGHKNATLIMHTDPLDAEGPNLFHIVDLLGLKDRVIFSNQRTSFDDMRSMYAACDTVVNYSCAEGFGLPMLEAMYCGRPIIALKTGGLERQVVDYRDGSENGIALPVEYKSLVGSQMVPYIVEDHVTNETKASALLKMYELGDEKRLALGRKAKAYAHEEFSMEKLIKTWDESLETTIKTWSQKYKPWEMITL